MTFNETQDLERFRHYLKILARLQLDREVQHKLDESDVVQETLVKAYESLPHFRGHSDGELKGWLRRILATTLVDSVRPLYRRKRNVDLERSLEAALNESSERLESCLAADQSTPSEQA
ncbi:MAG: sigma factor, partial [Planctomycetota bacterium]